MPEQEQLLFQADPEAFMKVVMIEEPGARLDALKGNLDDVVLCEIIRYGVFNDAAMIASLQELYRKGVLATYTEERRRTLFRHLKGLVDNVDWISVNALLPFIAEESLPDIVATAVIDYVSLGPLTNGDPMSRPKDIASMIESGRLRNAGAAFGGLLHLGDRRVCQLIWPLRDLLDSADVQSAVKCTTGYLYSASVEFEIDWLEEMDGDEVDGLFGVVASGLARQKQHNQFDVVLTGQRVFPLARNPTAEDQKRFRELAKPVSVEEYTRRIAPRLYALERSEPPPRIMPVVLDVWGLTPVTDPSEVARRDDGHRPATGQQVEGVAADSDADIVEVREEWFEGQGQIFLSWGILNPNGPTLYCLGERRIEGERRLFFRWLHMLGGATYYARTGGGKQLTYNEIYRCAVAFSRYLSERNLPTLFDVIPSFVIPNNDDDTIKDMARQLIAADAPERKDWGREAAYIEAFGDDYFGRAGCEIRLFYETQKAKPDLSDADREYLKWTEIRYGNIPAFREAVFPEFRSSGLTPDLFDRWWNIVSQNAHSHSALKQLVEMWRGATSTLTNDTAKNVIDFDRVAGFLTDFGFSFPR